MPKTQTSEEREFQSELNQAHKETDVEPKGESTFSPGFAINTIEMLLILGFAVIADFIDALDLTGLGAILVRFIDIPILGILWLWRILKIGFGPIKSHTYALLLAFIVEVSPFGMVPSWTILVIYVWLKDWKVGRQVLAKKVKKIRKIKK